MAQSVFGPQSATRAWYSNTVFFTAPSLLRIPVSAPGILNGSKETYYYLSFVWYYIQLILNDSNRTTQCGSSPIDWGYTTASVNNLSLYDSVPQSMVMLTILTKALQNSQNGMGPQFGCIGGWNWRDSMPTNLVTRESTPMWHELSPTTRTTLLNAYVNSWFGVASTFTPQQFYQGSWTTSTERCHLVSLAQILPARSRS